MKLYLHIGHGKTGSSYLQSWLACNAAKIENDSGLIYPQRLSGRDQLADNRALLGRFSQGNGFVFDRLLQFRNRPRRQRRWLRRNSGSFEDSALRFNGLIFSFEGWARRFVSLLPDLDVLMDCWGLEQVELLLLVRDPLEHACSAYGQMVKRHGYCGSLDDWLGSYRFTQRLLESLEAIAAAAPRLRLTAAHYGRDRNGLLPVLQRWLHLDPSWPWQQPAQLLINRSLTVEELRLMRHLNAQIGDCAARVGEHLVDRLPQESAARLQPSWEAVQSFQKRWQQPVALINQLLPRAAQLTLAPPEWMLTRLSSFSNEGELGDVIQLSSAQLACLVDGLWQPHRSATSAPQD